MLKKFKAKLLNYFISAASTILGFPVAQLHTAVYTHA